MMLAYTCQVNRPQAVRANQRCVQTLNTELDVAPSAETSALFAQLSH